VHAVQLELTQCSYMQETMPFAYLPERAARVQPTLRALLDVVLEHARRG
jgi:N-formylglutamate deformylase